MSSLRVKYILVGNVIYVSTLQKLFFICCRYPFNCVHSRNCGVVGCNNYGHRLHFFLYCFGKISCNANDENQITFNVIFILVFLMITFLK